MYEKHTIDDAVAVATAAPADDNDDDDDDGNVCKYQWQPYNFHSKL